MITKYITRINRFDTSFKPDALHSSRYSIIGDGEGDFAQYGSQATEECLEAYIKDCEEQIALAREMLEKKK